MPIVAVATTSLLDAIIMTYINRPTQRLASKY